MKQFKHLLIMRHAKSSWKKSGTNDHDRPLNKRGKRDAPRMGELLIEKKRVPELILSSTATRARSTASLVAEGADYDGVVELDDNLYHPSVSNCIEVLRKLYYNYASILLVAHNPGMEELLLHFTGQYHFFPTATIAFVKLPLSSWRDLTMQTKGKLKNIWKPKDFA
ncbi:phosphoglycerate mutase family domain protein [hydrothermal vent metagenome]|uniref:Phosphoglycerate mutase family domain protein n=1 Tax=hydrothermal vent metagenome TaxID=652676 RepID=A0A3B1E842_9ZZZZ